MTDLEAMSRAIELAKNGLGFVSPNPPVGCVILDADRRLIGEGYHRKVGGPHAEVEALNSVSDPAALKGAHVFVTLEPCAHYGRTPPCADRLASLPISRLCFGLTDPNPKVSGHGLEKVRRAGISVEPIVGLEDDLETLAEVFLTNMRERRPFVHLKVASSLDGQTALSSGESKWITSESARVKVQELRGFSDAVLIGLATFEHDNPSLDARDPRFRGRPNRAVLLDPNGSSLPKIKDSNLFKVRAPEDLLIVTGTGVTLPEEITGVRHLPLPQNKSGLIDWEHIFKALFDQGIGSVLVEGGSMVHSQLLNEKRADRLSVFLAPKLLGPGLGWTRGLEVSRLSEAPTLTRVQTLVVGPDLFITGRLRAGVSST